MVQKDDPICKESPTAVLPSLSMATRFEVFYEDDEEEKYCSEGQENLDISLNDSGANMQIPSFKNTMTSKNSLNA
jgi:hypothetical protein